jgi:IS5 family transposase
MSCFERYTKKTKRALFLEAMEQVVVWRDLGALIEPYYPKAAADGRRWGWRGCRGYIFCSRS